jgi:hypothetical protein
MKKRYQVTLVIEMNEDANDEYNVLKFFKHNNVIQMNETVAEIKLCGIKEVVKHG